MIDNEMRARRLDELRTALATVERERDELAASLAVARGFIARYSSPDFHDEWCSTRLDGANRSCTCVYGMARELMQQLADPRGRLAAHDARLIEHICALNPWIDRKRMQAALAAAPQIETEQETDGRWLAEAVHFPGLLAYGQDREEAIKFVMEMLRAAAPEAKP